MLVNILNICSDDELFCQDDDMSDLADALKGTMTEEQINEYRQKKQAEKAKLQKKILGIGRMARHFQQMREDAEKSEFSNFFEFGKLTTLFQTYNSKVWPRQPLWMGARLPSLAHP